MALRITNTLSGCKELFEPLGDPVSMYVCGMTPKFHPHIGHARLFVAIDLIRRTLEWRGHRVRHVQNFTDIDDKIIARANAEGRPASDVARLYTDSFFDSMRRLGVKPAHLHPTVTESMPRIIAFVEDLVRDGHAYVVNGDVYFAVEAFPSYGKLSGRTEEGGLVGARKELEPGKHDPRDFALWKSAKPGEPSWASPWGEGRPGWHIECSTMVRETLGDQVDLHCGGQDLIFPHHENEIAQSESLTGREPFARYWAHVGLVMTGGEKMSHSLMNFTTINDLLDRHDPAAVRLYLLQVHYRAPMLFSEEALAAAGRALRTLRVARVPEALNSDATNQEASGLMERFAEFLEDDFNSPGAIGVLFDTAHAVNRASLGSSHRAALQAAFETMIDVLGIPLTAEDAPTREVAAVPFIELLVRVRSELRSERQWALADRVRDGLKVLGVLLEDSSQGTSWRMEDRDAPEA